MEDITNRQFDVLRYIYLHNHNRGFAPSIREIGERLKIASLKTTHDDLKALERSGCITRTERSSRSMNITRQGRKALGFNDDPANASKTVLVPVVARVTSAPLDLSDSNVKERLRVDLSRVGGSGRDVFGLGVRGDSMNRDGMVDGSILLVRKASKARSGAIVVALFDDGVTCKRYYPEGDQIRLQPSNPKVAPMYVKKADVGGGLVVGVVVSVWRSFEDDWGAPVRPA